MSQNRYKWLQKVPNGSKWHQMAPNGSKWLYIALNSSEYLQIAPKKSNSSKQLQMAGNGWNRLKITDWMARAGAVLALVLILLLLTLSHKRSLFNNMCFLILGICYTYFQMTGTTEMKLRWQFKLYDKVAQQLQCLLDLIGMKVKFYTFTNNFIQRLDYCFERNKIIIVSYQLPRAALEVQLSVGLSVRLSVCLSVGIHL